MSAFFTAIAVLIAWFVLVLLYVWCCLVWAKHSSKKKFKNFSGFWDGLLRPPTGWSSRKDNTLQILFVFGVILSPIGFSIAGPIAAIHVWGDFNIDRMISKELKRLEQEELLEKVQGKLNAEYEVAK